jgi:hypothetical protein
MEVTLCQWNVHMCMCYMLSDFKLILHVPVPACHATSDTLAYHSNIQLSKLDRAVSISASWPAEGK